ncbi:MAG: TIGR02186 family protein [Gemmobacter sp.]
MIRWLILILCLAMPLRAEEVVADLSQNRIAITANFDGSQITVYGAVRREAPVPAGDLHVIVTVEGPSTPVTVRRKSRVMGVWINTDAARITRAPVFYALATTGNLPQILSETEDLRHRISINRAIRDVGLASMVEDSPGFVEALIRLNRRAGNYHTDEGAVSLIRDTLFRADFALPANLTEGLFRVRIFLLRDGAVLDHQSEVIDVHKAGLERFLHRLAYDQPLIYGLLSLVLAVAAGWGASAAFRAFRP